MALTSNPFTTVIAGNTVIAQRQPRSRLAEAANQLTPLTMLTAEEVRRLSLAGQQLIGTDETLIYKYREEFLHIQQVAEKGLTALDLLIENTAEFKILAEAWGFTVVVRDRFNNNLVYTKNLNQIDYKTKITNVNIDWSKPNPATIDVEYYRQSGNLSVLADSTLLMPNVQNIEASVLYATKIAYGITDNSDYNKPAQYPFTKTGKGLGGKVAINISNGVPYPNGSGSAIINGGYGYRVGDVITFPGTRLGSTVEIELRSYYGKSIIHTLTISISEVDTFGCIQTFSSSGTGGANWPYTVLDLQTGAVTGYAV